MKLRKLPKITGANYKGYINMKVHSALYLNVVIYLSHGSILILIIFTAEIVMGQLEVTNRPGSCYCIGNWEKAQLFWELVDEQKTIAMQMKPGNMK